MGQRSHAAEQVLEENTGVRRKSDVKKFIVRLKVDNKQTNGECVPGQTDFPLFRLLLITKGSLFTVLPNAANYFSSSDKKQQCQRLTIIKKRGCQHFRHVRIYMSMANCPCPLVVRLS